MPTEPGPGDELLLALLRDGLRDPEIAVRLGVTIAEARARAERLCARLEPGEYPEIAHRYRTTALLAQADGPLLPGAVPAGVAARQQPAPGLAEPTAPVRRHERVGLVPLAGSIVAVAAAVALVGRLAGFEGLSPIPPPPSRAAAASSQGVLAVTVSGIPFRIVTGSLSTHFPPKVGVVVEDRCPDPSTSCQHVQGLDLITSNASFIQRTVLQSVAAIPGASIDGSFVSGDGRSLAVVIDAPGRSPEARVSRDGGTTWGDALTLSEFDMQPVGFIGSELVLRTSDGRFVRAPSGELINTDSSGVPVGTANDGQVLFWLDHELFFGGNEWILQPNLPGDVNINWAAQRPDGTYAVGWLARIRNNQTWVIALLAPSGNVSSGLVGLERAPAGFVDSTHALMVADRFGNVPAILNLTNAELSPIAGAFDGYNSRAGRFIVGVVPNASGS